MIHLQMQGLLGNNLFQYAVARILSEDLGFALEVTHSPYKAAQNVPQLKALLSHCKDARLCIPGKTFHDPIDMSAALGHEGFDGHCIDLEKMRCNRHDRKIVVEGFFERYEIFRPHKHRIRSWLAVDATDLGHDVSSDDVVMHVRRGDFIVFGRAISLRFYADILDKLDFRRLYICGFGIDREVKRTFRRYDPVYVNSTPVDDFRFITGFSRIIQSQSTFAWWAGFLSQAHELYAPIPERNSTQFERAWPQIDLRVDDESRYHYVYDIPHLARPTSLSDIVTARHQLPRESLKMALMNVAQRQWPVRLARQVQDASSPLSSQLADVASWVRDYVAWELIYRRKHYVRGRYKFSNVPKSKRFDGTHQKVVVIRMNHSYAGFFAYFTFALNQLLFCERNECLPVVYFDRWSGDGENAYFDELRGQNMWEYYFEPVAGASYEDVQRWIREPAHPLHSDDVVSLTDEDLWYLHCFESRSIYAYTYERHRLKTQFDAQWYDHQRNTANTAIRKWIRVKPEILNAVERFYDEHMVGKHVLGMHLRGTDKGAAAGSEVTREKVEPETYFLEIDGYLQQNPDCWLFVATDQVQYLAQIQQRYGERVLANDCLRSDNEFAPFQLAEGSGYAKGAEVLIDVLLLARCDYLLKCSSHVGEAALWFNPTIPSLDLNYLA